ncbi:MAG: triose-phosphate isomerase [Actinomycetota bacterium]|nr:triose-phosphate isomerase [Actinomycetota bacterium]
MKYLLANWKMFKTPSQSVALFTEIQEGLKERASYHDSLPVPILCPPFLSLVLIRALIDHDLARLGGQNCHWESEGPYTGEISPTMLKEVADYVMLGHSERRAAGEVDEHIAKKVAAAARAGLIPILFVGEDEQTDAAASQSEGRLVAGLSGIDPEEHRVLVVYEPTWAVGADRPAEVNYVREVVEYLKSRMLEMRIKEPEIIYGGTVSSETVERFAELEVLDGVGATRASLDASEFLAMVDQLGSRA